MRRSILLSLATLLISAAFLQAETRLVPGDYATIQAAISDSNDGDVVVVSPGTYRETINFLGRNIVVTSTDPGDPEIVAATTIDAGGEGSVVTFMNGETQDALLTGFTITGGYGTDPFDEGAFSGVGILCAESSPTITKNVIVNNRGPAIAEPQVISYGGGIGCFESNAVITNNIIKNNAAYAGAGVMMSGGNARVADNVIYGNSATIGGGVLLLESGRLLNNTIASNGLSREVPGGGSGIAGNVHVESSIEPDRIQIINNIICDAKSGGGLFTVSTGEIVIAFNDVWNNTGGNYGSMDLQTRERTFDGAVDKTGTDGNISQDPLFAGPQSGDYHLLLDSPCIGAGDPDFIPGPDGTDIDGDSRIFAAIVDIGADEYLGYKGPVANAGPDQHVETPRLITLDGSGSLFYDPNGAATFLWEQFAGPEVQLSDPTSVQTQFTPQADGEYRLVLIVSDGTHSSRADEVLVTVRNRPPVADAGPDQTWGSIPVTVTLDGKGSHDPGDQAITYHWRQIAGPAVELSNENAAEPAFAPSELGVCVFELVANDGLIDSEPDIVGIVIGNSAPTANAGSSRYAAVDPVILDGTDSFDRDGYGELTYQWRQVTGQTVDIADANTTTPTVSGFTQAGTIHRCIFELIVSDGDLLSRPDTVEVIIVPSFSGTVLQLENPPFDPNKPTFIYFNGGNGGGGLGAGPPWEERANMISFDTQHYGRMWSEHGNAIIVYLSSVAPDYIQRIQTSGHSNGARLPIVVGAYINTTYADSRYNVNHATVSDGPNPVLPEIPDFLNSSVGGEQSWVDNYRAGPSSAWPGQVIEGALTVYFPLGDHRTPITWYLNSIDPDNLDWIGDVYNNGVTAGAYYSVIGPGKNLELAPHSSSLRYYFEWDAPAFGPGSLEFYNESLYPGRLPELPTLVGPADGDTVDANGVVLSCQVCQNVVGYQLLMGPNPHDLKYIISDTPTPPENVITAFPHETIYWTIKVRDQYGSTIFPDPRRIESESIRAQPIENVATGKTYPSIQNAINDADTGDEIVVSPGIYRHFENIDFKGKAVTVRSTDPNDPDVVSATIINGRGQGAAVTFSAGEGADSVLAGITVTSGEWGVFCTGSSPTVTRCVIRGNKGAGVRLWNLSNPAITLCDIVTNGGAGVEMILYETGRYSNTNYPTITNCVVAANSLHGVVGGIPTITNCTIADNLIGGVDDSVAIVTNSIIYLNGDGTKDNQISNGEATVTYTDVQGGWPGVGNIDADPQFVSMHVWADHNNLGTGAETDDDYHLRSTGARWSIAAGTWMADDITSLCINAGDPDSPLGGELPFSPDGADGELGQNTRINMGAYGGTSQASLAARQ